MSWQTFLAKADDHVTAPWMSGRTIYAENRKFTVKGPLPPEQGWHTFSVTGGRDARYRHPADVDVTTLLAKPQISLGYVVCYRGVWRFVPDAARLSPTSAKYLEQTEPVYFVEIGLTRFSHVRTMRWIDGTLLYLDCGFPTGPEDDVYARFCDRAASVSDIPNVSPALDLAFRLESMARDEAERRMAEMAARIKEEAERRALEDQRANLVRQLGDGRGRREMAVLDFAAAARAALRVGGAELLDWRPSRVAHEAVVQFQCHGRRFECVAHMQTLRIVEAGICLVNHATNVKSDTSFTLESLPSVIGEAIQARKLVVFRHVAQNGAINDDDDGDYDDDDGRY